MNAKQTLQNLNQFSSDAAETLWQLHGQVNVNGELAPAGEAKISVFDRSFLYGDSLYEVARTYDGKLFRLKDHLDRLASSAKLCRMNLSHSLEHYGQEMTRTVEAFKKSYLARQSTASGTSGRVPELYVRLIVTRGLGKIGFGEENLLAPTQYVILVMPAPLTSPAVWEKGLHLQIAERARNSPRALDPAMKSGNYLNNLLAYLEKKNASDAILCDLEGNVTEGTTFNIFYVKRGIVVTSPLDIGILDGITRRLLLSILPKSGIPVREVRFPASRLLQADEVFATSTLKEVMPVTMINDGLVADGKPGALTRRCQALFQEIYVEGDRS